MKKKKAGAIFSREPKRKNILIFVLENRAGQLAFFGGEGAKAKRRRESAGERKALGTQKGEYNGRKERLGK